MYQAYAARPHPDHGMTAPTYEAIPGAVGDTVEAARDAIPAAMKSKFGELPDWRVQRVMREAHIMEVKE